MAKKITVEPQPYHNLMKNAGIDAMRPYITRYNMTSLELLAVLSQMVGVALAGQDSQLYTAEDLMTMVSENIEIGNATGVKIILDERDKKDKG